MLTPIPTGFDGLLSFATDADGPIIEADRIADGPKPVPAARLETFDEPNDRDDGAFAGAIKKFGGLALVVLLLLAVKTCLSADSPTDLDSSTPSSYDESTVLDDYSASSEGDYPGGDTIMVENMGESDDAVVEEQSDAANDITSDPSYEEYWGYDADSSSNIEVGPSVESRPLPGGSVLTMSELQYCLAEDIRLSGYKSEMENLQFSDSERFNRNVDDFNSTVDRYNNVCSDRQFVSSQRARAESNTSSRRYRLESEGRNRVQ